MRIVIDTSQRTVQADADGRSHSMELFSNEAFELISQLWLKVGWNQKYTYTFTWLGRPVIQLPEDLLRIQEVIYRVKPNVIIETGVAHGGSAVFYASLLRAMGKGRVIGIDILIRPHNRRAIESHELSDLITLVEGSSTDAETLSQVRAMVGHGETVLVVLDSRHDKAHVLRELELYGPLVTRGSYLVATDGVMRHLEDAPRGGKDWSWNNPADAALQFVHEHPEFVLESPARVFDESTQVAGVTHWPDAWLRRT